MTQWSAAQTYTRALQLLSGVRVPHDPPSESQRANWQATVDWFQANLPDGVVLCRRCGAVLTNEQSKNAGVGATCAEHEAEEAA